MKYHTDCVVEMNQDHHILIFLLGFNSSDQVTCVIYLGLISRGNASIEWSLILLSSERHQYRWQDGFLWLRLYEDELFCCFWLPCYPFGKGAIIYYGSLTHLVLWQLITELWPRKIDLMIYWVVCLCLNLWPKFGMSYSSFIIFSFGYLIFLQFCTFYVHGFEVISFCCWVNSQIVSSGLFFNNTRVFSSKMKNHTPPLQRRILTLPPNFSTVNSVNNGGDQTQESGVILG